MGESQRSNLEAATAFYAAGPATTDEERRGYFAADFIWHVPGDTDLSGDYSGDAYFTDMPARMQPLDELEFHIESLASNQNVVVSVARIRSTATEVQVRRAFATAAATAFLLLYVPACASSGLASFPWSACRCSPAVTSPTKIVAATNPW